MCIFRNTGTSFAIGLLVFALVATLPQESHSQRSQPGVRKCTMAADEVDSLVNLLEDMELDPTSEESEESESEETAVLPASNPTCTAQLARMRNSVRRLQESYQRLKFHINDNVWEYRTRKNSYEQQKRDLTQKLEQLAGQVSAQNRSALSVLRRKIKNAEQQLASSVKELEKQRQENENLLISLVADKITAGKLPEAHNKLEQLVIYSNEPYPAIVQKVFQGNPHQAAELLIEFLKRVDFQYRPIGGYEALVDTMIDRQTLRGRNAIELLKHIQSLVLARLGQQHERAVALLKKFRMNAS
ncbi:uncharacterized protein LOC131211872 [Anopheles bellator]|uniref:uncharacterized protein LOC131211872 n=1 Tax=Anopheles bellator TaxID=139047 RepID=UPI0026499AD3|nr:uncharacterized protein LOC131211872 [Anopheles bellator]